MAKKKKDQKEAMRELLEAIIGPEATEVIEVMAKTTKKMGILIAVRNLGGSKDYDAIVKEIHKDKPYAPAEFIREIVEELYPELVKEKMIRKDGTLVPMAVQVANEYDMMLNPEKQMQN